jgi:hypothetical protein
VDGSRMIAAVAVVRAEKKVLLYSGCGAGCRC